MENNEHLYVVSVYSENQVGLLGVIANTFTRRSLNIESLTVFPSEFEGVHRFTFKTRSTEEKVSSIVKHIEKKVDVLKAFYYIDNEYLVQEHRILDEYMKRNNK